MEKFIKKSNRNDRIESLGHRFGRLQALARRHPRKSVADETITMAEFILL
jgi:hypothetical protein